MGKRKVLTREEYAEKFKEQMNRFNYIPKPGEEIVQCKEKYRNYWFISNKGYLLSAYKNDVAILKPRFDKTGVANKAGERNGKSWRYGTRFTGDKNLTRFDMGQMMADHFGKNEFASDEEVEIHHISKRNNFEKDDAAMCNRADNLQILPKSVHQNLTHYANKTNDELDEEMKKKIEDSGCATYAFAGSGFKNFMFQAINFALANGVRPVIYEMSLDKDAAQIKAEAHPIDNIEPMRSI